MSRTMLRFVFNHKYSSHFLSVYGFNIQYECQLCTSCKLKVWTSAKKDMVNGSVKNTEKTPKIVLKSKKKTKKDWSPLVKVLISRRFEEKALFGELVTIKPEQKKRTKLKNTERTAVARALNVEFLTMLNPLKMSLRAIHQNTQNESKFVNTSSENSADEESTKDNSCESQSSPNQEDDLSVKATDDIENIVRIYKFENLINESTYTNEKIIDTSPSLHKYEKLPSKILNNISSVSIFDSALSKDNTPKSKGLSVFSPTDIQQLKFPSVTNVLRDTMSLQAQMFLAKWKENMIKTLGPEEFNVYYKELLQNGKLLHSCIASILTRKKCRVTPTLLPSLKSLRQVFVDITSVKKIEAYVAHPTLHYKGIVDCIASYRGEQYVIDWKKSDKPKLTLEATYDAPIQLAAYIGAINASTSLTITKGLVIVCYTNGESATVHELKDDELQKYWQIWLRRLHTYHENMASVAP